MAIWELAKRLGCGMAELANAIKATKINGRLNADRCRVWTEVEADRLALRIRLTKKIAAIRGS